MTAFFPAISVCTTSYNSAHAIQEHLRSLRDSLAGFPFEYVVVDNKSSDGTHRALADLSKTFLNLTVISRRCSRGTGRQLAARLARASTILWVDTDTVYRSTLGLFVKRYFEIFGGRDVALQAIYAGLYPKSLWFAVGGTRNLNYAEDLDLWIRLWTLGKMRWTPVVVGDNMKPRDAQNSDDFRYSRYSKMEQIRRVLRREADIWRLREYYRMDLESVWKTSAIDLGIDKLETEWFSGRPVGSLRDSARRMRRDLTQILSGPV